MKKIETKKLIKYSYITLLIVCLALSLIFFCSSWIGYYKSITKYNKERQQTEYDFITKEIAYAADMLIPKNADMLYNYYSEKTGESVLYAYFKCREEPTEFAEHPYIQEKNTEVKEWEKEKFYKYFNMWESNCVPKKYQPNLENRFCCYTWGYSFVFYFPDDYTIIVFFG